MHQFEYHAQTVCMEAVAFLVWMNQILLWLPQAQKRLVSVLGKSPELLVFYEARPPVATSATSGCSSSGKFVARHYLVFVGNSPVIIPTSYSSCCFAFSLYGNSLRVATCSFPFAIGLVSSPVGCRAFISFSLHSRTMVKPALSLDLLL